MNIVISYVPYLILLFAVVMGFCNQRRMSMMSAVVACVAAMALDYVSWLGLAALLSTGLALWFADKYKFLYGVFAILAAALVTHKIPGFQNLKIFDGVQYSADAVPFTMYLNLDKTMVGLFLCWFFVPSGKLIRPDLIATVKVLAVLIALLMPLTLAFGYVDFDLKIPSVVWVFNNLFFVCFAEEMLFRGFVQGGLGRIFKKAHYLIPIGIAALLFGLAHFSGGPAYVVWATVAGLFYGYAYWRTGKIESAILVHFGLNLAHILFFTYPALQ